MLIKNAEEKDLSSDLKLIHLSKCKHTNPAGS